MSALGMWVTLHQPKALHRPVWVAIFLVVLVGSTASNSILQKQEEAKRLNEQRERDLKDLADRQSLTAITIQLAGLAQRRPEEPVRIQVPLIIRDKTSPPPPPLSPTASSAPSAPQYPSPSQSPPPSAAPQSAATIPYSEEEIRRSEIYTVLRRLWLAENPDSDIARRGVYAVPPEEWLNEQLSKLGESWRVVVNGRRIRMYIPGKEPIPYM